MSIPPTTWYLTTVPSECSAKTAWKWPGGSIPSDTLCSVFPVWLGFSNTIFAVTLLFPQPHPHQSCAHPCGCHSCSRCRHCGSAAPGQLAQAEARGRCAQGVGDGEDAGRLVAGPGKGAGDRACKERGARRRRTGWSNQGQCMLRTSGQSPQMVLEGAEAGLPSPGDAFCLLWGKAEPSREHKEL